MSDPVRLRGHHLLCMLSYVGKGYTSAFIQNFDAISARIAAGANMVIVDGSDDICAAMHDKNGPICESGEHCLKQGAASRDHVALAALSATLNQSIMVGSIIKFDREQYAHLRQLFANGSIRQACIGCEWHDVCTSIADQGFKDARLMPQAIS